MGCSEPKLPSDDHTTEPPNRPSAAMGRLVEHDDGMAMEDRSSNSLSDRFVDAREVDFDNQVEHEDGLLQAFQLQPNKRAKLTTDT